MNARSLVAAVVTLLVTLVLGCLFIHWRSFPMSQWRFPERQRLFGATGMGGALPLVAAIERTSYSFVVVDYPDHLPLNGTGRIQVRYNPSGFEVNEDQMPAQEGEPVDELSMNLKGMDFVIEGQQDKKMSVNGERSSTVEWLVKPESLNAKELTLAFEATLKTEKGETTSHRAMPLTIEPVLDLETAIREFATSIYSWVVSLSFAALVGYLVGKRKKDG